MNERKTVCIIGGGIAGLSSAVFLAEKGFKVTLIESSPKLGGRAYSFFDKTLGAKIDNGQHILAGWYKSTFRFMRLIGTYGQLSFQKGLEVYFRDTKTHEYSLKSGGLPYPFDLFGGLLGYKALKYNDCLSVISLIKKIKSGKMNIDELKNINTDELLKLTSQSERTVYYFWKPFITAVFNSEPEDVSAVIFANVIREGFKDKESSSLVLPDVFLSEMFTESSERFLKSRNAEILLNKRVTGLHFKDDQLSHVITEDRINVKCDYYISAVPFLEFDKLFPDVAYIRAGTLKASPIVNIHLIFEKNIEGIFKKRFTGLLDTKCQWIFRITDKQICIVISAAEEIAELDKQEIINLAKNELIICFPEVKNYNIKSERIIKEMYATFKPDKDSLNTRLTSQTKYKNLFIAGDWTDTGLPATIEGAVRSAEKCVELINKSLN
ncbi:MAG: hydroxysqualene dehydroxylase HpnE [Ignavibacteria bacterium]|nr:hydroxysqualene dehydroxylase HpnE [Ignavibacteria bacterium]